mmetsp:Transcript_7738/g.21691  ORF Transcript_7738/g.21691 Transcript_7738/m.21691 type:complete len:90 (-) Transcript_7738:240-509(-)
MPRPLRTCPLVRGALASIKLAHAFKWGSSGPNGRVRALTNFSRPFAYFVLPVSLMLSKPVEIIEQAYRSVKAMHVFCLAGSRFDELESK